MTILAMQGLEAIAFAHVQSLNKSIYRTCTTIDHYNWSGFRTITFVYWMKPQDTGIS